ncbi:MAG TPA: type II toxin-antitoxin system VapC family toxin [Solirubrobacteraceae bacterium]|nr:type II toxin-antitoxin system VapC family toxin [Solirubrobacteraceae bacterium]
MIVLDAWAVLAVLNDEPAAARVERALADDAGLISWINLGEVLYRAIPRRGEHRALDAVRSVRRRLRVEDVDGALVTDAARLKAAHRLSYADAFCVATARRHDAPLYTGDPEILALKDLAQLVDLRAEPAS